MDKIYVETVRLLLDTAPHVFHSDRLALKEGTVLNLFLRELPRLFVDIDMVYTDHRPTREDEMKKIFSTQKESKETLDRIGIHSEFLRTKAGEEEEMLVQRGNSEGKIKVPPNWSLSPSKGGTLRPAAYILTNILRPDSSPAL